MPRPIWKGAISFGLVTIPVNLYSAVEGRESLAFHLLHKKDGSRIEQKRFCKEEGIEVPWSEAVKGYEYAVSPRVSPQRRLHDASDAGSEADLRRAGARAGG